MNWQPIATAPRDRPVMVWIAGDFQYPTHARWGNGEWSCYEKNEGHLSTDDLITHWDEVPEGPEGTTTETRQGVARAKDETL